MAGCWLFRGCDSREMHAEGGGKPMAVTRAA